MRRFVGTSSLPFARSAVNAWRVARTIRRMLTGSAASLAGSTPTR